MRTILWRTLFVLVLGGGSIGVLYQGYRWYQLRPVPSGALALNSNHSGRFELAPFVIEINAETAQLTVTQVGHPQKVLWQTLPQQSFLTSGRGLATITEARGMFTITDERLFICNDQSIDEVMQEGQTLTITGFLYCNGDSQTAAYQLIFETVNETQLQFRVQVENPTHNRLYLTYASQAEEHFFGFGEQFSHFDLKGHRVPILVSEQGVGRGAQPITAGANIQAGAGGSAYTTYAAVPHYITSELRSLYLENNEYTVFDLRADEFVQVTLFANHLSGRILAGDSPTELITSYTETIGRMRPLPAWILSGAVVGMQGGTAKVRQVWAQLAEQNTPLAAFWLQDWVGQRTTSFGKQLWWNWELDPARYPNWDALVSDLAAEDVRIMTYINPFFADAAEKENYQRNLLAEAQENGYLVKNEQGDPYMILNTSFSAGLLDLTNPAAREWMKAVIRDEVLAAGASGWMADFGEALPFDALLFEGDAAAYHNQYPQEWARLNREVIDELENGDEIVFFSRSGFRESPRYTTLFWLGDQLVSWDEHDGIKTAVTGLLSSGLSGYAYNHSDIGGYTTITSPIADYHRSEELLLRWMELSAFTIVYRSHEGNLPEANVQIYTNDTTLAHFAHFAQVYKAWEFYRLALVQEAAEAGLPVVRHPFIHYPDDPQVYELSYQQFMVGSELMVAPVLEESATDVSVYLPAGEWVYLWDGTVVSGGQIHTVDAPIGRPAVFYPQGSAVGETFAINLNNMGLLDSH
ncbi:MAG: alpha-glucosidase [Anaerolineales bacterium]|nr:alpha-glucosidase [Anaerolineales bacterium]